MYYSSIITKLTITSRNPSHFVMNLMWSYEKVTFNTERDVLSANKTFGYHGRLSRYNGAITKHVLHFLIKFKITL